jgi:flavin-binding protein dodecin
MQKIVELLCESEKSAEDAARAAITTVSSTLRDVQSLEVRPRPNRLDSSGITHYRVCAKVTYGTLPSR